MLVDLEVFEIPDIIEILNSIDLLKERIQEAIELIKQGAVDGLSIGFCATDFEYNNQGIRIIKKIDLMEVSIVTFPANRSAGITNFKTQNTILLKKSVEKLFLLVQKLTNLK